MIDYDAASVPIDFLAIMKEAYQSPSSASNLHHFQAVEDKATLAKNTIRGEKAPDSQQSPCAKQKVPVQFS